VAALVHDLLLEAGVTYGQGFRYVDALGVPVPVAGWTAKWQIRVSVADTGTPLLAGTPAIDLVTGEVLVAMSASATRALPASAVWGLEFYGPGLSPEVRIAQGKVKVTPEVVK